MSARPFCVDWLPAMVPGNIQADLESARLLKPLWYGAGDSRLFDVARTDWIYRKEFTVPGSFSGRRIRLCFDGVDYACEVWLNGARIRSRSSLRCRSSGEVFTCGLWCFAMIWVDRRFLPKCLQMRRGLTLLLVVSGTFLTAMGAKAIWDFLSR